MDLALLERTLADRGEPAYRARQVWEWAARGVPGYEAMTNVPAALRELLAAEVPFSTLELADEAQASDGTVKALFRTAEGHPVEAVLMRYRDGRRSICVSSQSGCPLTCSFCATGQMQFGRNLTASEILDQVLHFRRIEPVDHLVFMGMGEPLLNFENVLAECRRYNELRHRKVYVEYVMLAGVNDSPAHAKELAAVLDPAIFKVNLIPYNPTGMFDGSSRDAIAAFKHVLDRARIPATVRLTRGRDIAAACGQLAAARG
jgi:adenine C2-methylase RlmN of 23S rRNA A2503 and tRNA A37